MESQESEDSERTKKLKRRKILAKRNEDLSKSETSPLKTRDKGNKRNACVYIMFIIYYHYIWAQNNVTKSQKAFPDQGIAFNIYNLH